MHVLITHKIKIFEIKKKREKKKSESVQTWKQHGVSNFSLLDMIWFTSQWTFVNLEIVALDDDPVSRQQITCNASLSWFSMRRGTIIDYFPLISSRREPRRTRHEQLKSNKNRILQWIPIQTTCSERFRINSVSCLVSASCQGNTATTLGSCDLHRTCFPWKTQGMNSRMPNCNFKSLESCHSELGASEASSCQNPRGFDVLIK